MPDRSLLLLLLAGAPLSAQVPDSVAATPNCPRCAEWNAPHAPFRVFGNAWFVGTNGLSAVLVTSPQGHILIDGGLAESARPIAASIRALGFRVEDVKLIVNSHVHYDHAGGIAELQRLSGAEVAASQSTSMVLRGGTPGTDDPQHDILPPIGSVQRVRVVASGDSVRVGSLALAYHKTAGHTPGGTSWSWRSCEDARCVEVVYADSQTPISADGFRFTNSSTYPNAVADFEDGFRTLESLRCDILVTPHPDASSLWERVKRRDAGEARALEDTTACRRYVAGARAALARRLAAEK